MPAKQCSWWLKFKFVKTELRSFIIELLLHLTYGSRVTSALAHCLRFLISDFELVLYLGNRVVLVLHASVVRVYVVSTSRGDAPLPLTNFGVDVVPIRVMWHCILLAILFIASEFA